MTQEEKAKAYDEALERAKEMIKAMTNIGGVAKVDDIQYLFPKLAESEDEKIRKALIDLVSTVGEYYLKSDSRSKMLLYLEKQKDAFENGRQLGIMQEQARQELQWPDEKIEWAELQSNFKSINEAFEDGKKEVIANPEKYNLCKPVECIEFDNEFENQVSHLLASVLNGEWEYNEGFVKHAAQSLMGYAKNEMKPDEWDKREKLFRKALQAANARIGQLFEENQKLKEQKPEWSEEDEEHRKFILELLEDQIRFCKKDAEGAWHAKQIRTAQNWFKFLRPQPHTVSVKDATKFGNLEYERGIKDGIQSEKSRQWRPSEEQMDSLRDTIINTKGYSYSMYLPELYEQLNKNLNHEELPAGTA